MNGHVLVVEDHEQTRRVMCELLERAGLQVRSTDSVAGAMAELSSVPSLIVLDLKLIDGDGSQVLRETRNRSLPTKVAIVSAVTNVALLESIRSLHPDAIFGKPLDFEDFVDWMTETFEEPDRFNSSTH